MLTLVAGAEKGNANPNAQIIHCESKWFDISDKDVQPPPRVVPRVVV
jgi:hypothetical protein